MATRKPDENDGSLPFAALTLLAPPVRLVSAALWKVVTKRDVMQYGVVEEVVTSACGTVPGLLTVRHQAKLALGLRGRLILELCSRGPEEKALVPHLTRMRAPAAMSTSSASAMKRDVKILKTVESFHSLVDILLKDPTERRRFYEEDFPLDYGPNFDQELEKLLWEFLIRLDQLLPVPSLAQTVSWLSEAPLVLEECARAATQPQLLRVLLQHETCLGHLEAAASLPPNMGDSILASLSLPPSGRIPSNRPTGGNMSRGDESNAAQRGDKAAFTTPVIGLLSNEDVPVMMRKTDATNEHLHPKKNLKYTGLKERQKKDEEREQRLKTAPKRSSGMKRKQPDEGESESEVEEEEEEEEEEVEEEEELCISSNREESPSTGLRNSASVTEQDRGSRAARAVESERRDLEGCLTRLGVRSLHLPDDPFLCSIFVSCLKSQPRVKVDKMTLAGAAEAAGNASCAKRPRRRSPVKAAAPSHSRPPRPELDDKENLPVLPSVSSSPSLQRRNTVTAGLPAGADDYVADSEDEATKNFKGRLFTKRYHKTKHGTYVPTLREFWRPGMMWRDLKSTGGKRR
ncbi:TERF1-interacting nuclear factor 2 isoform 2-T2 [Spinachia spinachia]